MKNKILKAITFIAFIIWITTVCALDSKLPLIKLIFINVVSGLWLVSHFYINRHYYEEKLNEES